MKGSRILATIGAIVLAGSVHAQTVHADFDAKTDFSQYRSFAIQADDSAPTPFVQERIEKAIAAQLEARGMKTAPADAADFVAHTHVRISSEKVVDFDTFGYAGYYHGWGGPGYTTATVREIPVGALMVDLVDAKGKKMLWRGVVEGTLSTNPTPAKSEKRINKAVVKLFRKYPVPLVPKKK